MKKVLIINNPNAGRKQSVFKKKLVINYLMNKDISFKSVTIDEINSVDCNDFDTVFVIGGDGTVNKVIPYIIGKNIKLAIIPSGTANLLAAKLGISVNTKKALAVIEKENIKNIDCIKINDKYSILRFGLGYDSDIICKTPQSLKNKFGYFSYFIAGILFALRLKQQKYQISFDDKKLFVLATCIIVANAGNMYKNMVSVSKNCKLDDGLTDIFILKVKNPIMFFFEFLQIIFNKKSSNSKAMYFQCSAINIKNDFCICHIDGEKQKIRDNICINIIPHSVNIYSN